MPLPIPIQVWDSASYAEKLMVWPAPTSFKSPVNLFFKFPKGSSVSNLSVLQYFSSKPKVCFDSTVA